MHTSWVRCGVTLFLPVCLTLSGCEFGWMAPTATTHCSTTAELSDGDAVEIESRHGSVHVTMDPSLSQVEIDGELRCGGTDLENAKARAESAQIAARYVESGRLRIEPAFPDRIQPQDGASLVVRLPHASGVLVATSNGAVVIQGAESAATGGVMAVSSNAPVEVRDIEGDVTVTSSNGAVVVTRIGGSVTARTSNASVHVEDASGEVRIDTSNGSIVFQGGDLHEGPILLETSNAPISATLGPHFRGRLDLDTSNARLRIEDAAQRIVDQKLHKSDGYLVIGDESMFSRLDTSNGSITVKVR